MLGVLPSACQVTAGSMGTRQALNGCIHRSLCICPACLPLLVWLQAPSPLLVLVLLLLLLLGL
jgi:hypothetical protein